jgi:hypothetical protein
VTEKLAYGQCRRCAAYAESPTYECATCGINDVEWFPMPVVYVATSNRGTVTFDGDEPANDHATAQNRRDVQHDHRSVMLPAAGVLAFCGSIACLIGAYQGSNASVSVSLVILGVTGGPFVMFALGAFAHRKKEQAFASAAATIGAVMSLGEAFISGLAGSLFTSSGAPSTILSVAPVLFVLAALAGGIAAGSRS